MSRWNVCRETDSYQIGLLGIATTHHASHGYIRLSLSLPKTTNFGPLPSHRAAVVRARPQPGWRPVFLIRPRVEYPPQSSSSHGDLHPSHSPCRNLTIVGASAWVERSSWLCEWQVGAQGKLAEDCARHQTPAAHIFTTHSGRWTRGYLNRARGIPSHRGGAVVLDTSSPMFSTCCRSESRRRPPSS